MPDTSVPSYSPSEPRRPYWLPDTQGFLAVAIIVLVFVVILILLLKDYTNLNEKVYGALLTLLGVIAACFKDVFSFFFGSSRGSDKKDDVISAIAQAPTPLLPPPSDPFTPPLTLNIDGADTVIKTIPDALAFASTYKPKDDLAGGASLAAILKTLTNGVSDTQKAEAFTKWAASESLIKTS